MEMISQLSSGLCALLLAAALPAAAADNAVMDADFGRNGFVRVDSAQGDTAQDRAVGICPGPAGSQVLVGVRAESGMLTLARLLPDGSLDASYGVQGRVEYPIATPSGAPPRNLCLGDGRLDLAYTTPAGKIELLRIAASGQPDAAFGSGGRVGIDPAALPGSNSGFMTLRGADRGTGGEILLSGELGGSGIGDGRAALIRVNANGTLRDSRLLSGGTHAYGGYIAAAGYAPNGDLWIAGISRQDAGGNAGWCFTWFRQVLDGVTLAGDAVELGPVGPWVYSVHGGRMVRPGVMALGMHLYASAGGVKVPRLQILRATDSHEVELPLIAGYGEMAGSALNLVVMAGGERVMYAASLSGADGIYLARVNVGSDSTGDGLDAAFGRNGATVVAMPGQPPGCDAADVPMQWFARLSLWDDQPVFVGTVAADCQAASARDLLVGRISRVTDRIFRGDFGP